MNDTSKSAGRGTLRERMLAGESVLGAWLMFSDPFVAEAMAHAGWDWLLVDMEHGPVSLDAAAAMVTAHPHHAGGADRARRPGTRARRSSARSTWAAPGSSCRWSTPPRTRARWCATRAIRLWASAAGAACGRCWRSAWTR